LQQRLLVTNMFCGLRSLDDEVSSAHGGECREGRPPVDDAHGVRVGHRLAHLVKVEESLRRMVGSYKENGRIWRWGGGVDDLLIGEMRVFADLAIDCAGKVAQLHVPAAGDGDAQAVCRE
jgi:hypothetical protein